MKKAFLTLIILFSNSLFLKAFECEKYSLGAMVFKFVYEHKNILAHMEYRNDFINALEILNDQFSYCLPGHVCHSHLSIGSKLGEDTAKFISDDFRKIIQDNASYAIEAGAFSKQEEAYIESIQLFIKVLKAITFYQDCNFGVCTEDFEVRLAYLKFAESNANLVPVKPKKCIIS